MSTIKAIILSTAIILGSQSSALAETNARTLLYSLGYCDFSETKTGQDIPCNWGMQTYASWTKNDHGNRVCKRIDKRTNGSVFRYSEKHVECNDSSQKVAIYSNPRDGISNGYEEQREVAFELMYALDGKENHEGGYTGLSFALAYIVKDLDNGPINRHGHGPDHDTICTAFVNYRMPSYNLEMIRAVAILSRGYMSESDKKAMILLTDDYVEGFAKLTGYCAPTSPKKKWSKKMTKLYRNLAEDLYEKTRKLRKMLAKNVAPALKREKQMELEVAGIDSVDFTDVQTCSVATHN